MNTSKDTSAEQEVLFRDLGLAKPILDALEKIKFTHPTPIQAEAIPVSLKGKDVIGIAQTGTGKTFAFTLPMIQRIGSIGGKGLILVPTRELAHQVREEIEKIGSRMGVRSVLLVGGANIHRQIQQLKKNPHIIVATPGRMIDHLDRRTIKLHDVQTLVLDEADRMLDMGFKPQLNQILETVPDTRQTLLFSATMEKEVATIAQNYMREPVRVEVAAPGTSAKNIEQGMYFVEQDKKLDLLLSNIKELEGGLAIVFCRTKHGTKKLAHTLNKKKIKSEELHSNRSLNQRRKALENFKTRRSQIMVATDVAARGIDVKEIALVVNFDLPEQLEDYVHRIGRTGRAGHKGRAVSYAKPEQYRDVKSIEKLVGKEIPVIQSELAITEDRLKSLEERYSKRGGGSYGGGRRGGRKGQYRGGRARRFHGGRNRGGRAERGNSDRQERGERSGRSGENRGFGSRDRGNKRNSAPRGENRGRRGFGNRDRSRHKTKQRQSSEA